MTVPPGNGGVSSTPTVSTTIYTTIPTTVYTTSITTTTAGVQTHNITIWKTGYVGHLPPYGAFETYLFTIPTGSFNAWLNTSFTSTQTVKFNVTRCSSINQTYCANNGAAWTTILSGKNQGQSFFQQLQPGATYTLNFFNQLSTNDTITFTNPVAPTWQTNN